MFHYFEVLNIRLILTTFFLKILAVRQNFSEFLKKYYLELISVVIIIISWVISYYRFWIFQDIVISTPDAREDYFISAEILRSFFLSKNPIYIDEYLLQPTFQRIFYPLNLAVIKIFLPFLDYYLIALILGLVSSGIGYAIFFKITKYFTQIRNERYLILFFFISISTVTYHSTRPITDHFGLMVALFTIYMYFKYVNNPKLMFLVLIYTGAVLAILTREAYVTLPLVFLFAPTTNILLKKRLTIFGLPIISGLIMLLFHPVLLKSFINFLPQSVIFNVFDLGATINSWIQHLVFNRLLFLISHENTLNAIGTSLLLPSIILIINIKSILEFQDQKLLLFLVFSVFIYGMFLFVLWPIHLFDRLFLPILWAFPLYLPQCFNFMSNQRYHSTTRNKTSPSEFNAISFVFAGLFVFLQFFISLIRILRHSFPHAIIQLYFLLGIIFLVYLLFYYYYKFIKSNNLPISYTKTPNSPRK